MAHYPLDESEGKETANAVGEQPGGVYAGSGRPEWVPGIVGNAVQLDGQGGHFNCGQPFSPERTDSFSYGCWFLQHDGYGELNAFLRKMQNARGIELGLKGEIKHATVKHTHAQQNGIAVFAPPPVSLGDWHHLMMTYDGSSKADGVRLYLDGIQYKNGFSFDTLSDTIQEPTAEFQIRSRVRADIDDVRIYNRRLSIKDVQQLYASGLRTVASVPAETRKPEQQALLSANFTRQDNLLIQLQNQLAAAEEALQHARWRAVRRWYVNSQGQTFVILDAGEFQMGSPVTETGRLDIELQHQRRIGRTFALAAKPVTVEQYRRYDKYYGQGAVSTERAELPAVSFTWYAAAKYCNWLSKEEGITEEEWCYEIDENEEYAVFLKANYLSLAGYRLPTEAEMEYATRSGTLTSRYYGETDELLPKYALVH